MAKQENKYQSQIYLDDEEKYKLFYRAQYISSVNGNYFCNIPTSKHYNQRSDGVRPEFITSFVHERVLPKELLDSAFECYKILMPLQGIDGKRDSLFLRSINNAYSLYLYIPGKVTCQKINRKPYVFKNIISAKHTVRLSSWDKTSIGLWRCKAFGNLYSLNGSKGDHYADSDQVDFLEPVELIATHSDIKDSTFMCIDYVTGKWDYVHSSKVSGVRAEQRMKTKQRFEARWKELEAQGITKQSVWGTNKSGAEESGAEK